MISQFVGGAGGCSKQAAGWAEDGWQVGAVKRQRGGRDRGWGGAEREAGLGTDARGDARDRELQSDAGARKGKWSS
eukprot:3481306-Rhodomonas_salina.2